MHSADPVELNLALKSPVGEWSCNNTYIHTYISIDFGGPYPDGHYNFRGIDQRTRYPVVEAVSSTGFKQTKEKLKKTFAYFGIPRRVTSNNGSPFN